MSKSKKFMLMALMLMTSVLPMWGETVNVTIPGMLSTLISESDKYTITELAVTGTLNEADFAFIRDMAGEKKNGTQSNGILSKLDLSGAVVTSQGISNSLPNDAFAFCQSLTTIILPDALETIGEEAFTDCASLTSILIGSTNTHFSSADGILYNREGTALLFCPAGKRTTVTIPDAVTTVGNTAFQYSHFVTLAIGAGLQTIDPVTFKGSYKFKTLQVSESNPNFTVSNKMLVTKDGSKLILSPVRLSAPQIPATVKEMGDRCMAYDELVTSIDIGEGVEKAGTEVMTGCIYLSKLSIPASLTDMSERCFYGLPALKEVYVYAETPASGENIFQPSDDCVLYVPSDTKALYENSTAFGVFKNIVGMAPNYPQAIVCEESTGTWCGWCPRGIVSLDRAKELYGDRFIGIAVHNNDPMVLSSYDNFMSSLGRSGFPYMIVNRNQEMSGDPDRLLSYCGYLSKQKSEAAINAVAMLDKDTRTANATTTVKFGKDYENANFKLSYIVIENDVHQPSNSNYSQRNYYSGGGSGAMGGFESKPDPVPASDMYYQFVARAAFGDFTGMAGSLPSSITAKQELTHEYSFTLPNNILVDDNCRLVVLLIEENGKIVNGVEKKWNETTAISEVNREQRTADERVFNINGQYVGDSLRYLPKGIYIKGGKKIAVTR